MMKKQEKKPAFLRANINDSMARAFVDKALTASGISWDDIPTIADLDAAILAQVADNPNRLDMTEWHCGTKHCRAGWAVQLAGLRRSENVVNKACDQAKFYNDDGHTNVGAAVLGAAVYMKSTPGNPIPDFVCSDARDALDDMHDRVLKQVLAERRASKAAA